MDQAGGKVLQRWNDLLAVGSSGGRHPLSPEAGRDHTVPGQDGAGTGQVPVMAAMGSRMVEIPQRRLDSGESLTQGVQESSVPGPDFLQPGARKPGDPPHQPALVGPECRTATGWNDPRHGELRRHLGDVPQRCDL